MILFKKEALKRLKRDDTGSSAIEYGLIAALIFLVVVAAINAVSDNTSNMFNNISNAVTKNS